jgi:cystathionine gamma-lyase
VAAPAVLASTYHLSADESADLESYGRSSNPTWRHVESALAELEGATSALVFSSGMAA